MAQNGRFGSPSLGLLLGLAAAAPALAASAVLALAWSSEIGVFAAIALSLVAGSFSAWLISRYFAQPIDEAITLATRFAAGETELRLDPSRGVPKFRDFATVLNSIADQVTEREQMFELVSEATGDAVWDWDAGTGTTNWTGELRTVFGVPEDRFSAPHDWWIGRIHPEDRQRVASSLATAVSASEPRWASEYRFRLEDGSYRWFWDRGVTLRDKCGQVQRAIGCMTDITGQRAAEERIWQLANQDEVTRLPNRALFYRRLAALLEPEGNTGGAVLLVDIVDFRTINGTHGHSLGDGLLKCFGARLQESVGARGSVFRLGGDKFAIILQERSERPEVEEIALFLLGRVREPFFLESQIVGLTATIGIVLFPENGSTPSELMKNADVALYAGKAQERRRIAFFDPEMRRAREQKVTLLAQIGRGLEDDQFEPHYQPIISLKDGTIVGAEALTRWTHPTEGLVTPAFFGSAYDDPELAIRLGKRLMEKVVDHYARWRDCGVAPPYLAVNVSAPGFRLPDLAERLLARFAEAGLPNSCFVIEVTETVLLTQDAGYVESNLRQLSAAGIRVALDDFGTGYASLTHLQQFPVDIIKIDKSFVGSMTSDTGSQAIVSAVLELGRRLDKSVIAEGVETMEQAAMLRAAGCRSAQGYLFAKPMPAEAFGRFSAKQLGRVRRTA